MLIYLNSIVNTPLQIYYTLQKYNKTKQRRYTKNNTVIDVVSFVMMEIMIGECT